MSVESSQEVSQYLTFKLENDLYALNVEGVREVLELELNHITQIPRTPESLRGVINVRGSVVPVINLRRKFGMAEVERTVDTCIIVMEVKVKDSTVVVSIVADAVQEVLDLDAGQIEPPPRLGTRLNTEFIQGMGNLDGQFVIILDIDRIFSIEELAVLDEQEKEFAAE